MSEMTRQKKMEHYAFKELNDFVQYDVFVDAEPDSFVCPDNDGDAMFCSNTWELMHGSSVRVLIEPGTEKQDVIRSLLKIAQWVNKDGVYDAKEVLSQANEWTKEMVEKGEGAYSFVGEERKG